MPDDSRWQRALEARQEGPWRGLDELLGERPSPDEFPPGFFEGDAEGLTRRHFLTLLGTAGALAGVACTRPPKEEIRPYVRQPELTPGVPLHFATAMVVDGLATGLLVKSLDGRPLKVDGHPEHPTTLGATGPQEQAAIRSLYSGRRLQAVRRGNEPSSWEAFFAELAQGDPAGADLALVLEPTSSPLVESLLAKVREKQPKARLHFYAPFTPRSPLGMQLVAGAPLLPHPALAKARVILALDADICGAGPYALTNARGFADGRRVEKASDPMNRLYAVEPTLTLSGIAADHRLALPPQRILDFARLLTSRVAALRGRTLPTPQVTLEPPVQRFFEALAKDLAANAGASYVLVGEHASPDLHALAQAMNVLLGNAGNTVTYAPSPILEQGTPSHDLDTLAGAMERKEIRRLLVIGGDPAYSHARFRGALANVPLVAAFAEHGNVTTSLAPWKLPRAHFLETWADARAADGTLSIAQPLIEPMFGGRDVPQLLAELAGEPPMRPVDRLKKFHEPKLPSGTRWNDVVQRGFVANSAFPAVTPTMKWDVVATILTTPPRPPAPLELQVRPDAKLHDGQFAFNEWLLELPDPVTKQTWGNAALVSPAFAAKNGLETGRIVRLTRGDRSLEVPVLVLPGHADGAVALAAGYGGLTLDADRIVGVNAFELGDGPVELVATSRSERLAITQDHSSMEGRPIAIERDLPAFREAPETRATEEQEHTLYEPPEHEGPQWAMAIDLNACVGCSACVVACQSENNIPVVGRENVLKSREMHWIRIDRYFAGPAEAPRAVVQPMLCQHCEKAPCEYVCPVNATTHSPDGINEMTYNRCVGTRFCSNNCPYKVRRFNWLDYRKHEPPVVQLAANPNVTVRARGVMEKCTFCVQRLRGAEIKARREGKPVGSVPVDVACAEACPTRAIVFGNLADKSAPVSKLVENPRAYEVLEELGTRPRVRYLAKLRNANPELES